MYDKQQPAILHIAKGPVTHLVISRSIRDPKERVKKYLARLLEPYAMIRYIQGGFPCVPYKLQAAILI